MFTNYKETLEFLFSQLPMYQRTGAAAYKANLENTHALCAMLGNPEKEIPAIHVAGTNGKGSVSHMLTSALMEQGFRVGLYTSPHLTDFRERITVKGKQISEQEVMDFVNKYKEQFVPVAPSFFEMTFAMALHHFREKNVQVAVFETGMGGRLDSTNVVKPVLSVITNIGHDHQQFLGDTIEKIAAEKAGIIKHGIPVVIGQKHPETEDVFLKKATEMSAPIIFAGEHLKVTEGEIIYTGENKTPEYKIFRMETLQQKIPEQILSGVMGSYQTENITTAAVAMAMLQNTNFPVSTTSIKEGFKNIIKNTALRGRWQTLQTSPLTVCDTGHNKEGIEQVAGMIKNTQYKKLHLVLGVVNDKDAASILQAFPANAAYYFCRASIPRSLDAEELKDTGKKIGLNDCEAFQSVPEAYETALRNCESDDLLFIGGSTFVVADLLEYLKK